MVTDIVLALLSIVASILVLIVAFRKPDSERSPSSGGDMEPPAKRPVTALLLLGAWFIVISVVVSTGDAVLEYFRDISDGKGGAEGNGESERPPADLFSVAYLFFGFYVAWFVIVTVTLLNYVRKNIF